MPQLDEKTEFVSTSPGENRKATEASASYF